LARLYRTAGMLMRAGIPAVRALEMVEGLLAKHLQPQLRKARALIEEGHPMSAALGSAGLATPVAARMMLVGERSGDMGQMLDQMCAAAAAFDLVPYGEATRRGCVALRNAEGEIAVVLGDPFDLDTQDWLEERLAVPFRYRLAHRRDVADYLARQESQMRALEGVAAE